MRIGKYNSEGKRIGRHNSNQGNSDNKNRKPIKREIHFGKYKSEHICREIHIKKRKQIGEVQAGKYKSEEYQQENTKRKTQIGKIQIEGIQIGNTNRKVHIGEYTPVNISRK